MLGVRVPRSLYTQLQQAAKADHRTLADWLRLNLPRLLAQIALERVQEPTETTHE